MIAEDKVVISRNSDMFHVKIYGQVDGYIPKDRVPKLDDILNSNIPYNTKLSQIRELINANEPS